MPRIDRTFVDTPTGRIHAAICGTGLPILLLHQTPRSWDEYRGVLPLLGSTFRAIAMDTPGFGDSEPIPDGDASIEAWAGAALQLLTALGDDQVAVVGHHTGAVVAMEIAARAPDRVGALVLSACPFVDAARRAHHSGQRVIDEVAQHADGRHLTELWGRRRPYYPPGDVDLLNRFIVDALRAGPMAAEGHKVVNRYHMEDAVGSVRCPTLVIAATADPHSNSPCRQVAHAITGSVLQEIVGGMVPLPDQMPDVFARFVHDFVRANMGSDAA